MRRLCSALLLSCVACQSATADQTPDGGLGDGGHALPGLGFAAAWQVKNPSELIGGPSSSGRVGDWELANARVRYLIEDARPSDGYDPYGCGLAAADRQRDAGEPGEGRWGEIFMSINFRAADCSSIGVGTPP